MTTHVLKAQLIILGLTIKEPVKGALISANKLELTYEHETFKNCILLQYQKNFETEIETLNQDQINIYLLEEINLLLEAVALLLSRPFQLISKTTWIDDQEVSLSLPPRKLPPGIYNIAGLMGRYRPKDTIKGYAAEVKQEFWNALELFITEFQKKPISDRNQLYLAMEWIAKGSREVLIGRLIAYWIAFNTLYKGLHRQDQEAIKICLQNNIDVEMANRITKNNIMRLKSVSKRHIELGRGTKKRVVSEDLRILLDLPNRNNIVVIETMTLVIYGIRNSLFHGDYIPDIEETDNIVGLAEQLLADLLREIIGKQVIGKSLPTTAYIGTEKTGI